jgi:predicted helicase
MALKKGIIKHPIVYANSVKRMRMFMACLKVMSKSYGVTIDYLQTFTSEDEIQQRINDLNTKFSKSKIGVVGNVYCLQEGISINAVDGIIMIDPRSSGSAIIQILGRPSRLDNNNPNKVAKVILPIIFEEVNGKVILDKTNFDTTRDWMLSIVASDSDFENMIFNDLHCISSKSRNGIEVKSVKVSNKKTSISGRNRNLDKNEIKLEKIDFRDYVEFSKLKTFLSTKRTNEIQRKTKAGKNEYLTNHATTFLIDIEKKVSKALEEYNIKNFSRYVDLIHSKKELVSLFATQYNITNYTAEKILNSININRVITKINKLDKLNYNNVLNLI